MLQGFCFTDQEEKSTEELCNITTQENTAKNQINNKILYKMTVQKVTRYNKRKKIKSAQTRNRTGVVGATIQSTATILSGLIREEKSLKKDEITK